MSPWLCLGIHGKQVNANTSAALLIGKPSQVHDDVDIKINDMRIESITDFPGMPNVTNFGLMLQAKYPPGIRHQLKKDTIILHQWYRAKLSMGFHLHI